jgi:hypothetical protein
MLKHNTVIVAETVLSQLLKHRAIQMLKHGVVQMLIHGAVQMLKHSAATVLYQILKLRVVTVMKQLLNHSTELDAETQYCIDAETQ